ncbi:MAG: acyl-CoA thioesterase [SAR324 cluster bacterium]|nr:acyl-CoA thioesterase [SAR324 cluster bacterium]
MNHPLLRNKFNPEPTLTHLLFDHLGLPMGQLSEDYGVVGLPIVDAKAKFLGPSKYWDEIEVTSWVSEVRETTLVVSHEVRNTGKLAVEGSELRAWATIHPEDSKRLKTLPIPEAVRRRLLASEG